MVLIVSNIEDYNNLGNNEFDNKIVIWNNLPDPRKINHPKYIGCEKLYINNCNCNYVYYMLRSSYFPNVKEIYFRTCCETEFFYRFPNTVKIYLTSFWKAQSYGVNNVIIIHDQQLKNEIKKYDKNLILF